MAVDIRESVEATDLSQIFGDIVDEPSNLFGEEQVEETEEEVEEEAEAEETEEGEPEEESPEEEKEEEKEEEEEKPNAVAENLKKALHAERAKRKEAAENMARLQQQIQNMSAESGQYKQAYDAVLASIKEYGLEDVVKVPKVEELSPEVLEARQIKQQKEVQENIKKFYDDVRVEATSLAPDYSNVNLSNAEHGTALTQIITAAVVNGMDKEAAVAEGLKVLDSIIATAKKEALQSRQPAVKPKSKPKARTKQPSVSTRDVSSAEGIDKLFASMGKKFAGG